MYGYFPCADSHSPKSVAINLSDILKLEAMVGLKRPNEPVLIETLPLMGSSFELKKGFIDIIFK